MKHFRHPSRKMFLLSCVLLLLMASTLSLSACTQPPPIQADPDQPRTIQGEYSQHVGDDLFVAVWPIGIVKLKKDGTQAALVLPESAGPFIILDDYIYYVPDQSWENEKEVVCRVSLTTGEKKHMLFERAVRPKGARSYGPKIIYMDGELYVVQIPEILMVDYGAYEGAEIFKINDDFTKATHVYSLDQVEKDTNYPYSFYALHDGYLYYSTYDSSIHSAFAPQIHYRMELKSKEFPGEKVIDEEEYQSFLSPIEKDGFFQGTSWGLSIDDSFPSYSYYQPNGDLANHSDMAQKVDGR